MKTNHMKAGYKIINEKQLIRLCEEQRINKGVDIHEVSELSGLTLTVIRRIEATHKAPATNIYFKYVNAIMQLTGMKWNIEGMESYVE